LLATIHAGLKEWAEASRGSGSRFRHDKPSQDALQNNLLSLITAQNAPQILRSLSPEEMDSPVAVTAALRWIDADLTAAARWLAACPYATDDQAWTVAHQAVEDAALMDELCGAPDSNWKQSFLKYASLEILPIDPTEASRIAERMSPGAGQSALLAQIAAGQASPPPR